MRAGAVTILICMYMCTGFDLLPGEKWESGNIDVNPEESLFYLLCRAREGADNPRALVLYLNGGPGSSSISNLFFENGPYLFDKDRKFFRNPHSWNQHYDILYIDNPVSVGFSYSRKPIYNCFTKDCYIPNLYHALLEFFRTHSKYYQVPFIISGMSYAGHYVPDLSRMVHENLKDNRIDYRGTFLFAPWVKFKQMAATPLYLYHNSIFGLWNLIKHMLNTLICFVQESITGHSSTKLCFNASQYCFMDSGVINVYNIMETRTYHNEFHAFQDYLNQPEALEVLKAKKEFRPNNFTVMEKIRDGDWIVSHAEDVEYLLKQGVPVMFAYGDKDLIVNNLGGVNMVEGMEWEGQKGFGEAKWEDVIVDGKSKGRVKRFKKLTLYLVYGAGHFISFDQPESALRIMSTFVNSLTH